MAPRDSSTLLAISAALSAALFALASWLFIEHWAYPQMIAAMRAFSEQGLSLSSQDDGGSVRMWLPYLTIAIAELCGGLALAHPKLRDAKLGWQLAALVGAIALGLLVALLAFLPPGITTWLMFFPPVLVMMIACWLVALPIALLVQRLGSRR